MSQSAITANSLTGLSKERMEVSEFIASIKSDLPTRIKMRVGSATSLEDNKGGEEQMPDFSNRKLSRSEEKYPNYYFKTQKWLGHISEMTAEGFKAKLEDLTNQGTAEYGEFYWEEISEEDRPLAQLGSAFYWWIGFSHENGQIGKISQIRFQRMLKWDGTYSDSAADRARLLAKNLKWE